MTAPGSSTTSAGDCTFIATAGTAGTAGVVDAAALAGVVGEEAGGAGEMGFAGAVATDEESPLNAKKSPTPMPITSIAASAPTPAKTYHRK